MESEAGEQNRLFRKNPKSNTIIKTSGAVSQRLVKNENRPTSLNLVHDDNTKSLNFPGIFFKREHRSRASIDLFSHFL